MLAAQSGHVEVEKGRKSETDGREDPGNGSSGALCASK